MRESDLHQHIYARSASLARAFADHARTGTLILGPGDDAAALLTPAGDRLLLTTDQLVEHRHFTGPALLTPTSTPPTNSLNTPGTPIELIARKALARSVSDIAAMGGRPWLALATALLPHRFPHADALFDAMHRWALHFRCPLVGGDIASHSDRPGQPLTLTTTVLGLIDPDARPITRAGVEPGDALWLTGPVGNSFASQRHLTFEPRVAHGLALARLPTTHAMIDLSDGLGRDAARLAVASRLRIDLDARLIPLHPDADLSVPTHILAAIAAGEDYELLIARDHADTDPAPPGLPTPLLGPIGHARPCAPNEPPGCSLLMPDGSRHDCADLGWDH